ncbi:cysteine-rich receptor-like protein kinase 3 [Amaranthus tricolor]|uniref:cysteine-rich receptor-like protein kinase 3 n=1 Tax=Amaranthus tricolor TaxID=29722 RepID=UPI002589532C|nr:cysteine-rich receptor-like protein kinase 3 [Amaranthus tricolor]
MGFSPARIIFCSLFCSLLLSPIFLIKPSFSDPRASEAGLICSKNKAPSIQRQTFVSNFIVALDSLIPHIASRGYGSTITGKGNLSVYAFAECMKDVMRSDCSICFAQIKTRIHKCLPYERLTRGGRVFFDGCYLRYDDHDFKEETFSKEDKAVCGSKRFSGNQTIFKENVIDLVKNISSQGVKNGGFYFGSLRRNNVTVNGLVQCWEFVNYSACKICLTNAISKINLCPPAIEGRALNSGCYLRYSTYKFYNNSGHPPTISHGASSLAIVLAVTLSALASAFLLAAFFTVGRDRLIIKKREEKKLKKLGNLNISKLNYSYETLEEATNYFHDSNKLGQGGSGSVYKGTLPDGTIVAVKRLFFNTRQWADHFFNEVDLISSIQHKNLVKLLGCSVTGPESLLVYELLPNHSLDCHLFGKKGLRPLSWDNRYRIILGIAEGLAYLHEEAKPRIIHRDIKLSNIMLDHDMKPKIADFGLVRLFPEDITHLSTAIAGTLGYMAPEYFVHGILTEKADVYSFGVVVIEVITGRKNNTISFSQDYMCMPHMIWRLNAKGRLDQAIDTALEGNFPSTEAPRVLQIGLLCVQANAKARPSMSLVVNMLNDKDYKIPEPTQPPFLNSSSAGITRDIQESTQSAAAVQSDASGDSTTIALMDS